jgi:hypothetical protein
MPVNPEECRRLALSCVRGAQSAATPQGRDRFAKLARGWIRMAEEFERSRVQLDEPKKRTGRP